MTAISIHIGLNLVDPNHYQGWNGQLRACENDARDMQAIATSCGYSKTTLLLTQDATSARVLEELAKAARILKAGDILLLTYSGHGGQVQAVNADEDDGLDETWVLYDRMLIDNELYNMWSQFASGVQIFMLSDSCHSGTVSRDSLFANFASKNLVSLLRDYGVSDESVPRLIPPDILQATYLKNENMYDSVRWSNLKENRSTIGAGVILISGCQDNQTSADGFTPIQF